MKLKGFNKKKHEDLSYSFDQTTEQQLKPRVLSTVEQIKAMSLRPEVKGSGDPSELPPYVIFVRGTPEAYKQLPEKHPDTLYFISDKDAEEGVLYLGDKVIASGISKKTKLSDLSDVLISEEIDPDSILIYEDGYWVNRDLSDILSDILVDFKGATSSNPGSSGLVPAPSIGAQTKFLKGDGTWDRLDGGDVDLDIISNEDIFNMMKED